MYVRVHDLLRPSVDDFNTDGLCQTMSVVPISNIDYFLTIRQPHNTRWMNKAERRLAQVRLAEDVGEADKDTTEDTYAPPAVFLI